MRLACGSEPYDAVVLDVGLPGIDGLALCQRIRKELRQTTPVLMLTARDTEQDKIAGFESGTDDYLVKPFSLVELDLRLKALGRRARGEIPRSPVLRVGDLIFDTATYEVRRAGLPVTLTKTGFKLLACLMRESPKVVSAKPWRWKSG